MAQKGGSEDAFVPQEKPSEVTLLTPHLPASGLTSKLRGAGHSHPVLRSTCPRLPGFPTPAIVTKKKKKTLKECALDNCYAAYFMVFCLSLNM